MDWTHGLSAWTEPSRSAPGDCVCAGLGIPPVPLPQDVGLLLALLKLKPITDDFSGAQPLLNCGRGGGYKYYLINDVNF